MPMNNDLRYIDNLFRSALEKHEETPSPSVKEGLIADLDKKDVKSYKKRFIGWKKTALFLLLILAGFILYESGILETRTAHSTGKIINEKAGTGTSVNDTTTDRGADNASIAIPDVDRKEVLRKKKHVAGERTGEGINEFFHSKQKENKNPAKDDIRIKKNKRDGELMVIKKRPGAPQIISLMV